MEYTTEQTQGDELVSFGIPHCDCGHCADELMDEEGVIVISMDALRLWNQGVCPGVKAA